MMYLNSTLRFSVCFGKNDIDSNYVLLIPHPDIDFFTPKIRPRAYYWTRKPKIRPRGGVFNFGTGGVFSENSSNPHFGLKGIQ